MKVAYIFAGGRLARGDHGPADFFYGARELSVTSGWQVDVIEVDLLRADPWTALLAGRLFGSFLPPRLNADWIARTRRILPKLTGYDVVVSTTTEISFGLALWKFLGFLDNALVGILCGAVNFPIGNGIRRKFASQLLSLFQSVLFAKSEEAEVKNCFSIDAQSLSIGWFGVDETFWMPPSSEVVRSGVLSVGNDGRRDYRTLVEAARLMPEIRFKIVTRLSAPSDLPNNVFWLRGDWKENALSDEELRSLYQSSACVVVPLKESIQPSGQSVAMQAMMCGAPVVITKTSGWWGDDVIRDMNEVALAPSDDPRSLARVIKNSLSSKSQSQAREALLLHRWTTSGFAERLGERVKIAFDLQKVGDSQVI